MPRFIKIGRDAAEQTKPLSGGSLFASEDVPRLSHLRPTIKTVAGSRMIYSRGLGIKLRRKAARP